MDTTARKVSDTKIEVTKTIKAHDEIHEYELDFLLKQVEAVTKQKADYCAARDAELAELKHLISHCTDLGIKSVEIKTEDINPTDIKIIPIDKII
jgi:hypothetical protein